MTATEKEKKLEEMQTRLYELARLYFDTNAKGNDGEASKLKVQYNKLFEEKNCLEESTNHYSILYRGAND